MLNASSGRNTATSDKFPNRVLTGSYDGGFSAKGFVKDLSLYRDAAEAAGAAGSVSEAVILLWKQFCERSGADADFTRIYDHVAGTDSTLH